MIIGRRKRSPNGARGLRTGLSKISRVSIVYYGTLRDPVRPKGGPHINYHEPLVREGAAGGGRNGCVYAGYYAVGRYLRTWCPYHSLSSGSLCDIPVPEPPPPRLPGRGRVTASRTEDACGGAVAFGAPRAAWTSSRDSEASDGLSSTTTRTVSSARVSTRACFEPGGTPDPRRLRPQVPAA